MTYTFNNPPVIKANFGVEPWSDVGVNPPNCFLFTTAGAAIAVDTNVMTAVAGTPFWVFKTGERVTTPFTDVAQEILYTIRRGASGQIVEQGSISLDKEAGFAVSDTAITDVKVDFPRALEIPGSSGNPKLFKISAWPLKVDGTTQTIDSAMIFISFANVLNTGIAGMSMVANVAGIYEYVWSVTNDLVEDIAEIKISIIKAGIPTVTTPSYTCQLFKKHTFNPVRIANGLVG